MSAPLPQRLLVPRELKPVSTIEKLDEDGFIHKVVVGGFELAGMEHMFRATSDGVLDENWLIVPGSHRLAFLGKVLMPWTFPKPKGRIWLKLSIEEMVSLENFLPELFRREIEGAAATDPAQIPLREAAMTSSARIAGLVQGCLLLEEV
jgi:hypothetical protein